MRRIRGWEEQTDGSWFTRASDPDGLRVVNVELVRMERPGRPREHAIEFVLIVGGRRDKNAFERHVCFGDRSPGKLKTWADAVLGGAQLRPWRAA